MELTVKKPTDNRSQNKMLKVDLLKDQGRSAILGKFNNVLFFAAGIILVILLLLPYASNGFWADDALNSQIYYFLKRVHGDLGDFSYRVVMHWLKHEGRPMLAFLYGYSGFYLFSDLFVLRLAQCVAILFNIVLYGYVLWLLGAKLRFLIVWGIFLVGLFQIHGAGFDPVAGFAFHYQMLGVQLSIVLILFIKWVLCKKQKYLFLALFAWLFFIFSYEVNLIFIPIALMVVLMGDDKNKKIPVLWLSIFALIYLVAIFYFRMEAAGGSYAGSSFGALSSILLSYFKQLTASLPFISYLVVTHNTLPFGLLIKDVIASPLAWGVLILGLLVFINFASLRPSVSSLKREAFILSLGMLFLPAIFPAISLRYQTEVNWGVGALPVYYQNFGLAFFAAWLLSLIPKSLLLRFCLPIVISCYLALNVTVNYGMVRVIDMVWREPRDAFSVQAKAGLFSEVQDGDIVRVKDVPNYVNENLIFQWTGKRVYVPTDDHYWYPQSPRTLARTFELSRNASNRTYELTPDSYPATLKEGIQFAAKPNYPDFIKSVTGMSGYETEGRWTEGKNIVFTFKKNLPTNFTLELDLAGVFGPNAGKEIQIEAGNWRGKFIVDVKSGRYKILVNTSMITDRIEFIIPEPRRPNELGASGDPRQLGIMFRRLSITTD